MRQICLLFVLLTSFIGEYNSVKEKTGNTVIHKMDYSVIPDDNDKLIYFTEGNDTLDFACIYTKEYHHLYVRFGMEISDAFSKNDTAMIADASRKDNYKQVDYSRQIKLLDQTLEYLASQDKGFTIKSIDYQMIHSGIVDVEITNEYNKNGGQKSLSSVVHDSRVRYDIDSILAPYHLKIERTIVSEGIYFLQPKQHFIKKNAADDFCCMPDSLLEFYAVMRIKNKPVD